MIQEVVSNSEVRETTNKPVEGFNNIKPETEMSTKELNDAVSSEFSKVYNDVPTQEITSSEIESNNSVESISPVPKEYFDDNGIKYREGDQLLPNTTFEVRGYQYKTDESGRVVSAEGQLRMRGADYERNMENVRDLSGQEYKENDQRGHLIGHQFDGSDRLENLVPMDGELNQGDYVKLENKLADAVNSGAKVELKVQPSYEKDSTRPTEFKVSYTIDGEKSVTVFKNESGDRL